MSIILTFILLFVNDIICLLVSVLYSAGFAKRFAILEKISSLLHMEPLSERNNTAMAFFSSPHECFFNSVTLRLSSVLSKWPTTILSIEQLIETYCSVVSDTNSSLIRVQESTSSSSVEWCYTEETVNKVRNNHCGNTNQ